MESFSPSRFSQKAARSNGARKTAAHPDDRDGRRRPRFRRGRGPRPGPIAAPAAQRHQYIGTAGTQHGGGTPRGRAQLARRASQPRRSKRRPLRWPRLRRSRCASSTRPRAGLRIVRRDARRRNGPSGTRRRWWAAAPGQCASFNSLQNVVRPSESMPSALNEASTSSMSACPLTCGDIARSTIRCARSNSSIDSVIRDLPPPEKLCRLAGPRAFPVRPPSGCARAADLPPPCRRTTKSGVPPARRTVGRGVTITMVLPFL